LDTVIETIDSKPDPAARSVLYDLLGEDNSRKSGLADRGDFAVLIKTRADGKVIGGAWAADDCGWAFIDLLYVPDELRGQRLGARILHEVEQVARGLGLIGMWVNTYDFQAKGFYERQGFVEFGRLEGEAAAVGQSFLKKRFTTTL
jgi:GNAT superfamily N-acetyltransferase